MREWMGFTEYRYLPLFLMTTDFLPKILLITDFLLWNLMVKAFKVIEIQEKIPITDKRFPIKNVLFSFGSNLFVIMLVWFPNSDIIDSLKNEIEEEIVNQAIRFSFGI